MTVEEYIATAPVDQQPVLQDLHAMIESHLPGLAKQVIGFPVWTKDEEWVAGLATRKKGPMLYVMRTGVLDKYEPKLGKARSGKSCIEYREELRPLADEILREVAASLE